MMGKEKKQVPPDFEKINVFVELASTSWRQNKQNELDTILNKLNRELENIPSSEIIEILTVLPENDSLSSHVATSNLFFPQNPFEVVTEGRFVFQVDGSLEEKDVTERSTNSQFPVLPRVEKIFIVAGMIGAFRYRAEPHEVPVVGVYPPGVSDVYPPFMRLDIPLPLIRRMQRKQS